MVRAPEFESGLREWRSHVLPLNTTPASGRAAALGAQADDNLRAGALRGPAHWQSTLLKSDSAPLSGVLQPAAPQRKTPGGLASIRAFSAAWALTAEMLALAGTSARIERARILTELRALALDKRVTLPPGQGAAARGRRFLVARHRGGDSR